MAAFGTGNQVAAAIPTGGVLGWGTWNQPNFVGELFRLSPLDTPLTTLIGGLTGGKSSEGHRVFTWQDTLHRAPAVPAIVEGADATFAAQDRTERKNVVSIKQYGVETTYSKMAETNVLGTAADPATSILGNQPVQDEHAWQLQIQIEQASLDCELEFLEGTFANPTNGTARQTQGIVGAITTNATDNTGSGSTKLRKAVVDAMTVGMYDEGAPMRNCVLMTTSQGKVDVASDYQGSSGNINPRSYNRFGVNITDIETNFGALPVVVNRHLEADTALIIDLSVMAICFQPIPGKGYFFLEPLAKSGSYDKSQLYGENGLEYGPEKWHSKTFNLDVA
jgi:hypothetical protein